MNDVKLGCGQAQLVWISVKTPWPLEYPARTFSLSRRVVLRPSIMLLSVVVMDQGNLVLLRPVPCVWPVWMIAPGNITPILWPILCCWLHWAAGTLTHWSENPAFWP